jgi:signal transduction histidine kinase
MLSNMNSAILGLTFMFSSLTFAPAIKAEDYTAKIESVAVNGEPAEIIFGDRVVIANNDSIKFQFQVSPDADKRPILYRVILIMNSRDTSVNVISSPEVRYANLPQADYTFEISAFDSNGDWRTKEDRIDFKVDNTLSSLLSKLKNLETKNDNLKEKIQELQNNSGVVSQISDIALIFLVLVILAFVVIYLKSKPKKKKPIIERSQEVKVAKTSNSNEEILEKENSNLREELKSLRMQIDKMQERSRSLILQNKDLQDKLNMTSKAKQELEDLQMQKEDLFATVVHDIKNPASIIKGLVDLLTNYDNNASNFDDIMKDIAASSNRILMLSSEISKIMALEGNGIQLHRELVDINDIASDVFTRNLYNARNKKLTYESMFDSDLPEVNVDILRIDEVMDNLISNAIKYTPTNGSILVETTWDKDKNHIVYSVSDTGQGLSEEDIKKTFQKGTTLSSTPTAGESATGLGLWIVKKMVEAHDGYVWVKSKKDEGSTFAFSIPVNQKTKPAKDTQEQLSKA